MTTKEWLQQYRIAKAAAERCFEDLDAADVLLRSPSYTGMPKGTQPKDLADTVAQLERLRKRAEKARNKAIRLADEISDAIDSVPDRQLKMLLWLRYISCRNWYDIADAMNMSVRSIYYLHGKALTSLQSVAHDTVVL